MPARRRARGDAATLQLAAPVRLASASVRTRVGIGSTRVGARPTQIRRTLGAVVPIACPQAPGCPGVRLCGWSRVRSITQPAARLVADARYDGPAGRDLAERGPSAPHIFVAELERSDRFRAFADGLPARARVRLICSPRSTGTSAGRCSSKLPRTRTRATPPMPPAGCSATNLAALFPGRCPGSAAATPPCRRAVPGARRPAARRLVCASATALAEGVPPPATRPAAVTLRPGDEPGVDGLAEAFALAGYERVERVEIAASSPSAAARGRVPATGREPLRVELFGDEIEQRAFSPFTQRALHRGAGARVPGGGSRRHDLVDVALPRRRDRGALDPRRPRRTRPDAARRRLVAGRRAVWEEEGLDPVDLTGAAELDPFPRGQPFAFEAQRPALTARAASPRPRTSSPRQRAGLRVLVAFASRRRGAAAADAPAGRSTRYSPPGSRSSRPELRRALRRGARASRLRLARPRLRAPSRHAGLPQRPPRADARLGRALASFADLRVGDHVVHEDHGVGKLLGFETRRSPASPATTCSSPSAVRISLYVPHEQIGKLALRRRRRPAAALQARGKAWHNQDARP